MNTPILRRIITGLLFSLAVAGHAQSPTPLVPADFPVPAKLETAEFRLRMLAVSDVVKDYDAVMSSTAHLQAVFGGKWPEGMSLEENLVDLGWHHKEFKRRTSFAYTVVAPDESRVLGCVYINPTRKRGYDAVVSLWARASELEKGLEARLEAAVKAWIAKEWPFQNVAYPGRGLSREEYQRLPDEKR
jgi:hypothetical protein